MNRRNFLCSSTVAGLTLAGSPSLLALEANNSYRANIGLQLYTVRNEIKADPAAAIKAVVKAGYKQGEMYGFPNCEPIIAAAREHGLALNSSHFEWDCVVNSTDASLADFRKILEKAGKTGLKHFVIPYLAEKNRISLDEYRRIAGQCNKAAAMARDAGIQLAYHNHSFEFKPMEGGKTGFDIFMEEFSPAMKFELDLFWVKAGGKDPVDLLNKLQGRVSQIHLKDLKDGIPLPDYGSLPPEAFQELGDGIIPTEPVLAAAKSAGVEHAHVEQDQSPDPIKSILQSAEYLRSL